MPSSNDAGLNEEQRDVFMEVISESLRVSQRTQLFNWLQGSFQYLLGHEVMIFGVKLSDNDAYQYEYFTSTRYFNDNQFSEVIAPDNGLISQVIKLWKKSTYPCFVTNQLKVANYINYNVINFDESILKQSELKNFVVHGFGDNNSKLSSVVILARLHHQPHANQASMLELVMPHLHCALIRVMSSRSSPSSNADNAASLITKRESEVLQWLHMGKTNWEISTILDISPLTVKNHVQNLIRKLNVLNRSQAAVKASKLGLIKMLK